MADEIYKGDDGVELELTIQDDVGVVDIRGCTITVTIKYKVSKTTKTAQILDGINGKCSITLNATDTADEGTHNFQAKVVFSDGKVFHSDKLFYFVEGSY